MIQKILSKRAAATLMALSLLFLVGLVAYPKQPVRHNQELLLKAPPFLQVAYADTEGNNFPEDEVGISAYYNAQTTIDLNAARDAFRTIETETSQYIIGSVNVPTYDESQDAHVYIHADGWIMAYYLSNDPAAKIFDWYDYNANGGTNMKSKLENVLITVASVAGTPYFTPIYYDFRYPNATKMMLIAEHSGGGSDFTVELPFSFVFYERSWGLYQSYGGSSSWVLNGVQIGSACWDCVNQGFISAAQMPPDTTHTISVNTHGGLALIYRE